MNEAYKAAQKEKDELLKMVADIRAQFVHILSLSINTSDTKGSCAFACFLAKELMQRFTKFKIMIRGGDGLGDGGYRAADGNMHGHYWLEVGCTHETYIVDITADQFGSEPVVILPLAAANQYINGCQDIVDDHFTDFLENLEP